MLLPIKRGEMALEKWLFSIFIYFMYASPETKTGLYKKKLSLKVIKYMLHRRLIDL